jgi:Pyridoxamine 5'-phosphate oxidase
MRQSSLHSHWPTICVLARASFKSSLRFALATVDAEGAPHVTPIGSLLLDRAEPRGLYFEIFTTQMPVNLSRDQRICVLGVTSSRWFWLRARQWSLQLASRVPSPGNGRRAPPGVS